MSEGCVVVVNPKMFAELQRKENELRERRSRTTTPELQEESCSMRAALLTPTPEVFKTYHYRISRSWRRRCG